MASETQERSWLKAELLEKIEALEKRILVLEGWFLNSNKPLTEDEGTGEEDY